MYSTPFSCQTLMKREFFDRFSKNTPTSNLMKIRPMEAELLHADGQSDMTKLSVAFRNFANASKNCIRSDKTVTVSEMLLAVTADGAAVTL